MSGVILFKKIIFALIIFLVFLGISCIYAEDNSTDLNPLEKSSSTIKVDLDSFSAFQKEIKDVKPNSKLYLKHSYKYKKNQDSSLKNGVVINKDLTIVGKNGCTIDGSGIARCLRIKEGCSVTLQNIKIKMVIRLQGERALRHIQIQKST